TAVADDRQLIADGDRVILVVDDDAGYARLLLDAVRRKGFRGIVTARGQAALSLARERLPAAVIAALHLPDMLAWTMLAGLKLDPATRHIPVQVLGVDDAAPERAARGAFSCRPRTSAPEEIEALIDRLAAFAGRERR